MLVGCQGGSAGGVGERGGLCDMEGDIGGGREGRGGGSQSPRAVSGKGLAQVRPIQSLMPLSPFLYKCQAFRDSGYPVIELWTVWGFG